jgi:hypothetical protein
MRASILVLILAAPAYSQTAAVPAAPGSSYSLADGVVVGQVQGFLKASDPSGGAGLIEPFNSLVLAWIDEADAGRKAALGDALRVLVNQDKEAATRFGAAGRDLDAVHALHQRAAALIREAGSNRELSRALAAAREWLSTPRETVVERSEQAEAEIGSAFRIPEPPGSLSVDQPESAAYEKLRNRLIFDFDSMKTDGRNEGILVRARRELGAESSVRLARHVIDRALAPDSPLILGTNEFGEAKTQWLAYRTRACSATSFGSPPRSEGFAGRPTPFKTTRPVRKAPWPISSFGSGSPRSRARSWPRRPSQSWSRRTATCSWISRPARFRS